MDGWRKNLIEIEPYVAGEQKEAPGLIKLNTNENPYPPSPSVEAALWSFPAGSLARYPDPSAGDFRRAVAERYGVRESRVFAGNGSDEVLALAFRAFFCSGRPVLFPDVTYSFYPVWCRLFGIPYRAPALDDSFRVRADDYDGRANENGGVVLPNPNAPTGVSEGKDFYRTVLESNPDSVVVVDEAYVDFGAESVLPLACEYDNLFVVRTLSKSHSLAGLRLGFGCGSPELIGALNAVKDSFNSYTVGRLAVALGCAALDDEAYYVDVAHRIAATRERFTAELRGLGFSATESVANFVFVSHPGIDAGALYKWLKERNILVRWFDGPRTRGRLRITIGRDEDMDALVAAIAEYI